MSRTWSDEVVALRLARARAAIVPPLPVPRTPEELAEMLRTSLAEIDAEHDRAAARINQRLGR